MTRQEYAKQINWNGTASRMINVNELPDYKINDVIEIGLCWTDGGEFQVETVRKYGILFEIVENVDGHAVDYDNEKECDDISATDCSREKEILIDRKFKVVDVWDYDTEVGFMQVFVKAI